MINFLKPWSKGLSNDMLIVNVNTCKCRVTLRKFYKKDNIILIKNNYATDLNTIEMSMSSHFSTNKATPI